MSDALDVRLLKVQTLPEGEFPGWQGQVFRVFFAPEVHGAIWKHAVEDLGVEICGVLVGTWQRDPGGPFVKITESIRGDSAENKFAEVTFTHATWAKINEQMDSRFAHLSIVGWYHTHPDFGVFLSDRDQFIQEHFFSGPGQIAHVVDPIRKTEGVFVWNQGKPALSPHFWVGDRIVLGTPAGSEDRSESTAPAGTVAPPGAETTAAQASSSSSSILPPPGRMLMYLLLFLTGYLLAGTRSSWERQLLEEGAVAHYGIWKGYRPGLRDELDTQGQNLLAIAKELAALRAGSLRPSDKDADSPDASWREVRARLAFGLERVELMKSLYCLTDSEQSALRRIIQEKTQEKTAVLSGGKLEGPASAVKAPERVPVQASKANEEQGKAAPAKAAGKPAPPK